jgi:subtilisin family serine protease
MPRSLKKLSTKLIKSTSTSGNVEVSTIQYVSGTYTRNESGVITITTATPHNLTSSDSVYVKFTSGDVVSKLFESITVSGSNTITVTDNQVGNTNGTTLVSKLLFTKSGTYFRDSHFKITIHIGSHGFTKGTSLYLKYLSGTLISSPGVIEKVNSSSSFTIVKKADPGGFYSVFGVKQFHESLEFGSGVKVYVIDEGFNDIDPTTPGIQTTTDLADFTQVFISDPGAGGGGLSHGGLVCALLGASRRNGAGIIGLCPDSTLFLADVDNISGDIFINKVVQAIDDAISRNVDIINISLGTSSNISALEQAIQRAINAGILVFASAGNSGTFGLEYPSSYPGVISVGSVNINRVLSSFNTRNNKIALFAPGEKYPLPSPLDETDFVYVDGTSFSSPFAAGLAALYMGKRRKELSNPTYRPSRSEIISVLSGEELLNTSELSYTIPSTTVSGSGAGVALAIVAVAIVFVLFVTTVNGRMKSIRTTT